jgi:hypothetical protein
VKKATSAIAQERIMQNLLLNVDLASACRDFDECHLVAPRPCSLTFGYRVSYVDGEEGPQGEVEAARRDMVRLHGALRRRHALHVSSAFKAGQKRALARATARAGDRGVSQEF